MVSIECSVGGFCRTQGHHLQNKDRNGKFSQTGAQHIATASGKHQQCGDSEQQPTVTYRNNEVYHGSMLLTEQLTSNLLSLQSFSLAVNALHNHSKSILSNLLAYNLFNCVIHYFPIIRRKGHALLIKCINLDLIHLMFSISKNTTKVLKSALPNKSYSLCIYL